MKHQLGITVFEEFFNENGREPTKEEFMALGYGRSWFYETRKNFRKMQENAAKKAINEALKNEMFKGKI